MLSKFYLFVTTLLFVSMTIAVSGCAGNASSATPTTKQVTKVLPKWIDAPLPSDNDRYMYGMAVESDRESAIKAALSDMIAKLGTTIESSFESNQEVRGSYSKSIVTNEIKSNISKIKINNYKVIKSYKVSYREFAVMIETDKLQLITGLKDNLRQQQKSIIQESNALKGRDSLSRYKIKKELSKRADKLLSEVLIISELDSSFDKQKNLDFIAQKQKEFLAESKEVKFFVSGDKKSLKFADIIRNHLAQQGFNVTNIKKDALQIKIKTSRYNSGNIAVLTLDVSLFDKSQRVGGKSMILKERYSSSDAAVYKNAAIHFKQDIESQGINETIGINLDMD